MPKDWVLKVAAEVGTAALGGALLWYLRRRFANADNAEEGPTLEELQRTYRKHDVVALLVLAVLVVGLFFGWLWILRRITVWHANWFEPAVYNLHASSVVLMLPAAFLAFTAAALGVTMLFRLWLRDRYSEYMRYADLKAGFNTSRAGAWLVTTVGALAWLGFLLALTWNIAFYDDHILFRSFLGLRNQTVPYGDIVDLVTAPQIRAPNGKLVDRREYRADFRDGSSWSTNRELSAMDLAQKQAIFEFLARKSKRPIRQLAVLE